MNIKTIASLIILFLFISCQKEQNVDLPKEVITNNATDSNLLRIDYYDRNPYYILKEGKLSGEGIITSRTEQILNMAKISFEWKEVPFVRSRSNIQANEGKICITSCFQNEERAKLGKFSLPIYQDKPTAIITYKRHKILKDGLSFEQILTNKNLVLLMKVGFSYGAFVDGLLEKFKPNKRLVTTENTSQFKMIQEKRVDFMFIEPTEAEGLIKAGNFNRDSFEIFKIKDAPEGNHRHFYCSNNVTDEEMNKINEAILKLGFK